MSARPTGRDAEGSLAHVVSLVLRTGVVLAGVAGVVAVGANLVRHSGERLALGTFRGTPEPDRHVGTILSGALAGNPRSLMMIALLLMIATPIVRVAVSLLGFVRERDRTYVAITIVVLLTLLASLAFGGATE